MLYLSRTVLSNEECKSNTLEVRITKIKVIDKLQQAHQDYVSNRKGIPIILVIQQPLTTTHVKHGSIGKRDKEFRGKQDSEKEYLNAIVQRDEKAVVYE